MALRKTMPSGHSIRRKTIDHRWPRPKTYKIIPNISRVTTKNASKATFFTAGLPLPFPALPAVAFRHVRRTATARRLLVLFVPLVLPHCLMRPIKARPADVPGVQGELRPAGAWGSAPHPSFFPSILLRVPSWSFVSLRVFIPIPTFSFIHHSGFPSTKGENKRIDVAVELSKTWTTPSPHSNGKRLSPIFLSVPCRGVVGKSAPPTPPIPGRPLPLSKTPAFPTIPKTLSTVLSTSPLPLGHCWEIV